MSNQRATVTTAKLGSTRCPGCEKRFADTPNMTKVETFAEVENRGRVDSIGQMHRGHGTHTVLRYWHESCLSALEASNAAYRAQVREDRRQMIVSLCEAAGTDPASHLADFDEESPHV